MAKQSDGNGVRHSTIYDVAKEAQVSPATVSHVLNGTAPISIPTQKRVFKAIRELDYRPNANARSLRAAKSQILGVIVQDISSEYYAQCTAGILQCAQQQDFVVLTTDIHFDPKILRKSIKALVDRRVDGLLFVGGTHDEDSIQLAASAGVPIVIGDRFLEGYPCAEFNNYETMHGLTHALYDAGYRRFAYMGEPTDRQQNLERRYDGVVRALDEIGVPDSDRTILLNPMMHPVKMKPAYQIFQQLIRETPREKLPEIVLTSNDMIAQSVISASLRNGLRVPDDIAVFGFDNISISIYCTPAISTVVQDPFLLGTVLFDMLKERIKHGEQKTVVLPQQIAVRSSAPVSPELLTRQGLVIHTD
jgi:LacI family transcriptional regulator